LITDKPTHKHFESLLESVITYQMSSERLKPLYRSRWFKRKRICWELPRFQGRGPDTKSSILLVIDSAAIHVKTTVAFKLQKDLQIELIGEPAGVGGGAVTMFSSYASTSSEDSRLSQTERATDA
jgi:hypothetical protein